MKLIDIQGGEVEVEDSWQEECPQCGDTNVECFYVPNWAATRCYDCLVNEAIKFNYKMVKSISTMSNDKWECLVCKKQLSFNYESTVVRKAIKPPRQPSRWITLGCVHEECEHLIELEQDSWKK